MDDVSLDQVYAPVIVDYQGQMYTFMSPVITSHCLPNWANWPFDTHVCTLTLGSKRYMGSTVDFHFFNSLNVSMILFYHLEKEKVCRKQYDMQLLKHQEYSLKKSLSD